MTRLITLALSFAVMVGAHLTAYARTPTMADVWNGAEINWRDIRSGIYESSKTGRPVIMVFHAPWCPSCKKFRSVFYDKQIVEASKDFVMILIDADADKSSNGAFSPDGTYVPRTLFLDSQGNVQSQLKGAGDPNYPHSINIDSPDELLSLMRKARATMKGFPPEQTAGDRT
ncbi:MAG: thioredoxin family protein [Hyphomicrobium sp.]